MTAISMSSPRAIAWPSILKEAAMTAFVALLLTIPLVGLRTVDRPTGLGLETRWNEVAAAVEIGRAHV